MNTFTIRPDGSLMQVSRLEADALADYTMEAPASTGDLFGDIDMIALEQGLGQDVASSAAYAGARRIA